MKKTCTQCKIEKSLDEFAKGSKASGYKFGVRAACKVCTNSKERIAYYANPEKTATNIAKRSRSQRKDLLENPQKYRAIYLKRDKEKTLASSRAWYARNIEEQRIRVGKWSKSNPAMAAKNRIKRMTVEMSATPPWLTAIHHALIQEMYDISEARNIQTGIKHHVDHIFPLRGRGFNGLHVPWNLQVLTASQNIAKKNKSPIQYSELFWKAI